MPNIKIHYFSDDLPRLQKTEKGDWIDLYCAQDMTLKAGEFALVPLGVSMQLPEGYEARTAPRSSTFRRWGILQANSVGVIDNSYCGTNDGRPHLPVSHLCGAAAGDIRGVRAAVGR